MSWTLVAQNQHHDATTFFSPSGTVIGSRVYDPFGRIAGSAGGTKAVVGFQGDFTDPTSGDVWMASRWYSPEMGRFTSRDSVAGDVTSPMSLNRFAYGNADPLGFFDPDGHWPGEGLVKKGVKAFNDHVVKPVTRTVSRAYHATTEAVSDAYHGVTDYVGDRYEAAKDFVVRNTKAVVSRTVAAAKYVGSKAATAAKYIGRAAKVAGKWAWEHKATIIAIAASAAVAIGCTAATGGAGVVGCAALAGAVYGGVNAGFAHCGGGHSATECISNVAIQAGIGAATGAATAGVGGAVTSALGSKAGGLIGSMVAEGVSGAAGDAVGQLITTGRVDWRQVAVAGATSAVVGGITHKMGANSKGATSKASSLDDVDNVKPSASRSRGGSSKNASSPAADAGGSSKPASSVESGTYVVKTSKGEYVGQSGNISRRMSEHVRSGKFTQIEADAAERFAVAGGKTQREIAEQMLIDQKGGIDQLLNKVNPIGAKRFDLMPSQPYSR